MIRSLLLATAFLLVTIAILATQPLSRPSGQDGGATTQAVARADGGVTATLADAQSNEQVEASLTRPVARPAAGAVASDASLADPVQDKVAAMTASILRELRDTPADAAAQDVQSAVSSSANPATREAVAPAATRVVAASSVLRPQARPAVFAADRADTGSAASPSLVDASLATPERAAPLDPVTASIRAAAASGASDQDLGRMVQEALLRGTLVLGPETYTAAGPLDLAAAVATLAPTRTRAMAQPPREAFFYRVRPSDSLAGLAALFYGDATAHAAILSENSALLSAAEDLIPGMLIRIPAL